MEPRPLHGSYWQRYECVHIHTHIYIFKEREKALFKSSVAILEMTTKTNERRLSVRLVLLLQDPECNPKLSNSDHGMDDEGCQEPCRESLDASEIVDGCAEGDYLENPVDMEEEVCYICWL